MSRFSTNASLFVVLAALGGCATNKEALLTHDDATMLDIWDQHTGGSSGAARANRELLDGRLRLRRPVMEPDDATAQSANATYTRTARTEIHRLFPRLPNPDLVMYVFPHLAGSEQVPVPGYIARCFRSTVTSSTHCRANAPMTTDDSTAPRANPQPMHGPGTSLT